MLRHRRCGVGLLQRGGQECSASACSPAGSAADLLDAGAYRVYKDPAELLKSLPDLGIDMSPATAVVFWQYNQACSNSGPCDLASGNLP